ncbi:cell division protein FtsY [Pelistega indica]|uniref:Signal recognition particle receptor FtsY n=1 Tax=Pelistega indica TaxID=1414851 RepID=V8G8T3_9BURK|nr:signal recognition particle-docking protein FtsY [Pelistega indica]ETD72373.1 cell division protein FtsY [Pelistega indica]
MFGFFKRWRSGDKDKEKLEHQQNAELEAVESVPVEQEEVATATVITQETPISQTVETSPSTILEVTPDPIEIPSPTLIPEPTINTVTNLPTVDSQLQEEQDGKVHIHVTLNEMAGTISDEELEAAALAEIPEDSPLRYESTNHTETDEDQDDNENTGIAKHSEPQSDVAIQSDVAQIPVEVTQTTEVVEPVADVIQTQEVVSEIESPQATEVEQQAISILDHGDESVSGGEEVIEEVIHSATPVAEKASWLSRLKKGLSRTGSSISAIFVGVKVDENLFEELETALIMSDAGLEATQSLLSKLRSKVKKERLDNAADVKKALHQLLTEHLKPLEKRFMLDQDITNVVMIAGVNGAGKTTSIGKLAHHFQESGASVLLAAGDTFRAAAREQLMEWGSRNNVHVISQDGGDPAAVAFDAVNAGKARKMNVVMVDTAGRLPTQTHLMEELKKIKRVISKADSSAPHEVLLVVDGNTGQNALAQIRAFDAVLGLTGLVVTKLDGTAKGGTLAAVAAGSQGVRPIPVYWIGVGEKLHDLQPFVASEFASALLGE